MRRLLALAIAAAMMPTANAAACRAISSPTVAPLVELYTSQGCSSCPPADRWLSELARNPPSNAVTIALHVGYWDYIGWKDPFARREFNQRQERLAAINGSRSIYTPEVFVQGRETPQWRDAGRFAEQLRALAARPAEATIRLDGITIAAGRVELEAQSALIKGKAAKDARLYVALVEDGLSSKVTAGENRGETLTNDRVTRAWSGPLPLGSQTVALATPNSRPRDLALVAFVEDAAGILQSVQVPLAGCTP